MVLQRARLPMCYGQRVHMRVEAGTWPPHTHSTTQTEIVCGVNGPLGGLGSLAVRSLDAGT